MNKVPERKSTIMQEQNSSQWLSELEVVNYFTGLGEDFFSRVRPDPLANPRLVDLSPETAKILGIDASADTSALVTFLNGQELPANFDPISMLYAGHQFGVWVPQLGDGRAMILAQISNKSDELWELQLKGSGATPYSRSADGRAVLRSTIREYLCSEAMQGLGIPTTRALGLIDSDTAVYREEVETGAILLRMAPTHLRFGNFEVFASRDQLEQVQALADFVLKHHRHELLNSESPYLDLYRDVIQRTAKLIAQWQSVGFSHGVMNTDNMSILGLTIDYGPFGFMEAYNPGYICNHSDHSGRYAFNQQADIAWWNLAALGNAMLSLLEIDEAKAAIQEYKTIYQKELSELHLRKLGLESQQAGDGQLIEDWLNLLDKQKVDFTNAFRALSHFSIDTETPAKLTKLFGDAKAFEDWIDRYRNRLAEQSTKDDKRQQQMLATNPKYILRNYLAENAIARAKQRDYSEVAKLRELLGNPFDEQPENEIYAESAPEWASGISVSCSS